jgi:hypothetical protein
MVAFAMMAVIRHHANQPSPLKNFETAADRPNLIRWSIQDFRRIATRLAQRRI